MLLISGISQVLFRPRCSFHQHDIHSLTDSASQLTVVNLLSSMYLMMCLAVSTFGKGHCTILRLLHAPIHDLSLQSTQSTCCLDLY